MVQWRTQSWDSDWQQPGLLPAMEETSQAVHSEKGLASHLMGSHVLFSPNFRLSKDEELTWSKVGVAPGFQRGARLLPK